MVMLVIVPLPVGMIVVVVMIVAGMIVMVVTGMIVVVVMMLVQRAADHVVLFHRQELLLADRLVGHLGELEDVVDDLLLEDGRTQCL